MSPFGFAPLLAHAFGKRYDLPVPLWLFVVGGALVVFASFLLVLPTAVRPATATGPRAGDAPALRPAAPARMALAWLLFIALAVGGWIGSQELAENILPTAFWLVVWIAVPVSCGLIGDWTRAVNPFAAVARLFDRDSLRSTLLGGAHRARWPARAGFWPAAALFFIVACGELVYNGTATLPSVTATAIVAYMALNALMGLLFGAEAWTARGELFSVLWSTWGRLGWWRFGAPGRRGFLGGLAAPFEASASRITFVLLLLVSVSFDGVLSTPGWKHFVTQLPDALLPGTTLFLLFETFVFAVFVGVAWLLFGGFAAAVRAVGHLEAGWMQVFAGLLRSLLPISFGYLVAHNADYLAINGQLLIPILGNPFGLSGVKLLPAPFNDSYVVNPNVLPSSVLWYGEVVLIIAVHVAAVFLAHQYLGRAARRVRDARRSEWPWIAAMVGYTMTSLWLLAQPVVQEAASRSSG
ncbi:MAG: hypothetical protein JOZ46_04270 [Candidatus Dormibacteraeota bacterium]|nr:hypothetical protein [Candidatus Dormibacteraeota bacterium]MBV9525015.1 hypothetical protein [Candidatus Dormibacteraeota bacterium]